MEEKILEQIIFLLNLLYSFSFESFVVKLVNTVKTNVTCGIQLVGTVSVVVTILAVLLSGGSHVQGNH